MDLILDSNRRLHGRLREIEAKVNQRTPAPAAKPLPQNPVKRPRRTGADFRHLNDLLEDNALRNQLVSFLSCLGGQKNEIYKVILDVFAGWNKTSAATLSDLETAFTKRLKRSLDNYVQRQNKEIRNNSWTENNQACSTSDATPDASALANQRFATLRQRPGQSVDDFAHDLRRLAAAAFTNLPESDRDRFILHQFITGLRDRAASGALLLHPPASLSSAIQPCRLYEESLESDWIPTPHQQPHPHDPPTQQTTFHFTSAIPGSQSGMPLLRSFQTTSSAMRTQPANVYEAVTQPLKDISLTSPQKEHKPPRPATDSYEPQHAQPYAAATLVAASSPTTPFADTAFPRSPPQPLRLTFKHLLNGLRFILHTDHRVRQWLRSFKDPMDQLTRWREFLQDFDFECQYRQGHIHGNADTLSRLPHVTDTDPGVQTADVNAITATMTNQTTPSSSSTTTPDSIPNSFRPFDGRIDIRSWLRRFLFHTNEVPQDQRCRLVYKYLGDDQLDKALDDGLSVSTPFDDFCDQLQRLFQPWLAIEDAVRRLIHRRRRFRETPEQFAADLTRSASDAYPSLLAANKDQVTLYHFKCGLDSDEVAYSLRLNPPNDLKSAIQIATRLLEPNPPGPVYHRSSGRSTFSPGYRRPGQGPRSRGSSRADNNTTLSLVRILGIARHMRTAEFDEEATCAAIAASAVLPPTSIDTVSPPDDTVAVTKKEELKSLLTTFSDVFAWDDTSLGRTAAIRHSIDTGTSKPLWRPPRRIPPHFQEDVSDLIQTMLTTGIIRPSKSPWASPATLVPKKTANPGFVETIDDLTRSPSAILSHFQELTSHSKRLPEPNGSQRWTSSPVIGKLKWNLKTAQKRRLYYHKGSSNSKPCRSGYVTQSQPSNN
nr:unnamed protein product [Spirometra erinaceieuropaei]